METILKPKDEDIQMRRARSNSKENNTPKARIGKLNRIETIPAINGICTIIIKND